MSAKRSTRAAPTKGVVYLTEDGPVQEDPLKDDALSQRLSRVRKEAQNAARRMYFDRNVSLGFCRGLPAPEVDADWDAFNARVEGRHYTQRG